MSIVEAALRQQLDEINTLLANGADVNSSSHGSQTALMVGARHQNSAILSRLLEMGAEVHTTDLVGSTALHEAAASGSVECTQLLLDAGADQRTCNIAKEVPRARAVSRGHDAVALLLEAAMADGRWTPADPTALRQLCEAGLADAVQDAIFCGHSAAPTESCDISVLALAVQSGHQHVVMTLLDNHCDPNEAGGGECPLVHAARQGNRAIAEVLLASGADVNARGKHRMSALAIACHCSHATLAQCLLDHRADVSTLDDYGAVAMHWAAHSGDEPSVKALLQVSCATDFAQHTHTDSAGNSALHMAAAQGKSCVVGLLIDSGSCTDALNHQSETPLMLATAAGHLDVVKVMTQAGTSHGDARNAMQVAASRGHTAVIKALLDAKCAPETDGTSLGCAVQHGHGPSLLLLADAGWPLNPSPPARSALAMAAAAGQAEMVSLLVSIDADVNYGEPDGTHRTALAFAAMNGQREAVTALLEADADLSAADCTGCCPMAVAALNGHTECIQLLLSANGELDARTRLGDTALSLAAFRGHKESVKLLIRKSANVEHKGNHGHTALMLAASQGHDEIVKLLVEKHDADLRVASVSIDHNYFTAEKLAALHQHPQVSDMLKHYAQNKDGSTGTEDQSFKDHLLGPRIPGLEAYSSGPTFTTTNADTKQQPKEGSAPPAVPAQLLTFLPESQYKHLGADKGPTVHLKGFAGRINFEDPTTAALATKLVHWVLEINPSRVCWDGDELSNDSFTALISRIHMELPDGLELVAFRRQEDRDTFDASWKNAQLPISVFLCDDALNWQQLGTHALSVTGAKSVGCLGGGGTIRDEFANRPTDDVKFTMFAITRLSAAGDVVEQAVLQDTKDPFIEVVH